MGATSGRQKQCEKPMRQNIILKRTTSSYHSLNSPRDIHKQYIWKKWKFYDEEKNEQMLKKLNSKLNKPHKYMVSVLDYQFTKTNVQHYKIRAKIQYSQKNLKSQIQLRKSQSLYYELNQLWAMIRQLCEIANFAHQNKMQLPQNLSSYLKFGNRIKIIDQQLLPNIKSQKKLCNNYNQILCRIITNLAHLSNNEGNVSMMEINKINIKYNVNLATFVYCIKQQSVGIPQVISLCQRLKQQNKQNLPKMYLSSVRSPKILQNTQPSQNNGPFPQGTIFITEKKELNLKRNPISEKAIIKCASTQSTSKNIKRIQEIKPKQSKMFCSATIMKRSQNSNQENKQNNLNINNMGKNKVAKSLQILQIDDHHFPKRNKQFIRTSSTQSQVTTSRLFQMKSSQARNQAFIKMTGGSKCDLFSQDQNQELLQSIIQSEQSIIIKNDQSPLMSIDQEMELFTQDFLKLQNSLQQVQKQQAKSLVEFGYQRNSTIMQVTQQNQQSAQAHDFQHSQIRVQLARDSSSHISQFQLQLQKQQEKFVIEQYEGGSRYEGYIVNGLRNGFGKLYYEDGGSYQGSWKNGEIQGYGKLFYQSGDLAYQGYWSRGQFHGQGKIINQKPDQIKGMFNYYDFSDIGIAWIEYEGSFQKDHKNGRGTLKLSNGEKYTGNWVRNNIHGQGVFTNLENKKIRGLWNTNILVQIKQKLQDQDLEFKN